MGSATIATGDYLCGMFNARRTLSIIALVLKPAS